MKLLKELCDTPGVSGFEGEVQKIVRRELATCCDEVRGDRVGNVMGLKKPVAGAGGEAGEGPEGAPLRIMFAAHVDEIGFMVKHVDKEGFLSFLPIGIYIMDKLTIGHPVLVKFLFDLCEEHGITYQRNIGGGTDASAMQKSRSGAMCTTIGAPTRYMHTTVQLCHVDDIEQTIVLLKTFAEHAHEMDVPADGLAG